MSNKFNIDYKNGFLTGTPGSGGSGSTYTGTNGITVDNSAHTIGLDTTGSGTPELGNLKITGDMVLDKGADFSADADAELNVYCEATFTNTVDMSAATIQVPSIGLTGTSGSVTEAQWNTLKASSITYIEKDNNKYYYCGVTYDTTDPDIVRTITYVCPQEGKIVITCNDPVSPATEYTYSWTFSSYHLYQHSLALCYYNSTDDTCAVVEIAIFTDSDTALTTSTVVSALNNYFGIISQATYGLVSNCFITNNALIPTSLLAFRCIYAGRFILYNINSTTQIDIPFAGNSTYTLQIVQDSVVQIR